MSSQTRRRFISNTGALATALAAAPLLGTRTSSVFAQGAQKKLGWALCGLGGLSENQIAPALQNARFSRLAGVITDTPAKASKWKEKYGLTDGSIFTYDTMHKLAGNPNIDVVYIVTPTLSTPSRQPPHSRPASTCSARSRWKCRCASANR